MVGMEVWEGLTSDLVSTAGGVHALNGLALLESGGGGGLEGYCQCDVAVCLEFIPSSYLLAAVDGGVLANAVDLVLAGLDGVVRLGSVARHGCGFGGLIGGRLIGLLYERVSW